MFSSLPLKLPTWARIIIVTVQQQQSRCSRSSAPETVTGNVKNVQGHRGAAQRGFRAVYPDLIQALTAEASSGRGRMTTSFSSQQQQQEPKLNDKDALATWLRKVRMQFLFCFHRELRGLRATLLLLYLLLFLFIELLGHDSDVPPEKGINLL